MVEITNHAHFRTEAAIGQRLAAEANPQMKTMLQRQIDMTDRQIDRLVYELYELTDEEIAIVEGT
jgi:hypothetical protein